MSVPSAWLSGPRGCPDDARRITRVEGRILAGLELSRVRFPGEARLVVLLAGIFLCAVLPALAGPEVYIRNRPLRGTVVSGGEHYASREALAGLFTEEELARVGVEGTSVLVDGKPVGQVLGGEGLLPVLAVAQALGFRLSRQPELGLLDLAPPAAQSRTQQAAATPVRAGPEHAEARERMKLILEEYPRARHPEWEARLKAIGARIVAQTPRPGVQWRFLVVRDEVPNAGTVGEGYVFVTDSLLRMNPSDDELAGILAHEVAHGILRHPFKANDLIADLQALIQDYQEFVEEWYRRPATGAATAADRQVFVNRKAEVDRRLEALVDEIDRLLEYGRAEEEAADMAGIRYAAAAGYHPTGLMDALQELEQVVQTFGRAYAAKGKGGARQGDMEIPDAPELRTHPPTARRVEILRRVLASWGR